jgi:type IV pilus assembly protein PilP
MSSTCRFFIQWLYIFLACGLLLACANESTTDLELYAKEVKNQQRSSIEPLPEFEPYESFDYQADDLRAPFTEATFSQPRAMARQASGNGIKPDFERPSEPLEEFPLDSLRMVGTLEQEDETWALIKDTDGTIHRTQPGNYAGQNHGKIYTVTEYEIGLTEIIPDGVGGWVERQASISISD